MLKSGGLPSDIFTMRSLKEEKRLKSLHELDILDTEAEQCFDDITFLASTICGAPISLISLIEEKRQWVKSKVGIDANEIPIEFSFCKHVINDDRVLLVHDPLSDERFKNNPFVTNGLMIRFYAGIPLKLKSGDNVGALCIVDTKPRDLTADQLQALMRLARQTEHLLSLRSLKRQDEWSQVIFNNSKDMMGIVKVDEASEWSLQAVNPAFCKTANLNIQKILPKPLATIITPTLLSVTLAHFTKIMDTKKSSEFEYTTTREGIDYWYETIINPKMDDDGRITHMLIISRDISERKKNELLIQQQNLAIAKSAKFSELGELAGSMAHEINNPLTVIVSRSNKMRSLLAKNELDDEAALKGINQIHETALRIGNIIRSLKAISRNADQDPMSVICLKSIIEDAHFLCEERLRTSDIRLNIDYPAHVSTELEARAPQLTQVLVNLLNNSVHAIGTLPEKWITISINQSMDGQNIIIKTTDSGEGIGQEIQNKIMDPFFTTKEFGKGTGLGLSISRGIIEAHNGKFYYDTKSKHTTFVIEIPKNHSILEKKISA